MGYKAATTHELYEKNTYFEKYQRKLASHESIQLIKLLLSLSVLKKLYFMPQIFENNI